MRKSNYLTGHAYNAAFIAIGRRDGFHCQECMTTFNLEIDHVRPVARGGSLSIGNLQILCRSCNTRKRDNYTPQFIVINPACTMCRGTGIVGDKQQCPCVLIPDPRCGRCYGYGWIENHNGKISATTLCECCKTDGYWLMQQARYKEIE